MSASHSIGLKGSLREAVVIVASILVAFGLDAWWDDLGERQAERELLMTLQAEFEGTLAASERIVRRHEQALEAATLIIGQSRGAVLGNETILVPDTILFRFVYAGTMNRSTGALDAALRGGQAGLIENPDLRSALTSWPGDFDDVMADEVNAEGQILHMYRNGFHAAGDISHITQHLVSYAGDTLTPDQRSRATRLTPTTAFVNDLGIRTLNLSAVLNAHDALQRRTEELLGLLAVELRDGGA